MQNDIFGKLAAFERDHEITISWFDQAFRRTTPKVAIRSQNFATLPWEVLDLGEYDVAEQLKGPSKNLDLSGCDLVLLETLSEGKIRKLLCSAVKREASVPVEVLPAAAVAEAALLAAQRASNGLPIFFDFLPRLSTIIYGPKGPMNFDLIRPEETLEAGRIYRSPEPASLAIPTGQKNISVFLRKEASPRPRKAKVEVGMPLKEQASVALWVEQKPASGRAKILLEAPSLGRQFTVDWSEAQEDDRSWIEIIESLESKVSIPNRLVLPCGVHAWETNGQSEGLHSLLEAELSRSETDWSILANKMMQRPFGQYCISSDGDIPQEIDPKSIERLDLLTEKAIELTKRRLRGESGPGMQDNKALQFLTWQFRRCPTEVAYWLLDCIETKSSSHPFIKGPSSWVLIYQGLGRIVNDDETEHRAMDLMLSSNIADWVWRNESAGMAFMLSRSDTAPLLLERNDVEMLSRRTIADFKRNIGNQYTMFNYAPFLLAGLLRWRLKENNALLVGVDPLADDLLAVVQEAEEDLIHRRQTSFNFQKARARFLPILQDLKAELQGEGTNPDLLLDIYGAKQG